jgi:hypothetical protein
MAIHIKLKQLAIGTGQEQLAIGNWHLANAHRFRNEVVANY